MTNTTQTAGQNGASKSPSSAVVQHQTSMTPLYPGKAGYKPAQAVGIGEPILATEPITYNDKRQSWKITVRNTGDRPIQVGSHFHFFEVNRYLDFDRAAAYGTHLNIPATTAIRFEPGDSREVEVVAYAGKRRVIGFNRLVNGYTGVEDSPTYYPARERAMRHMRHAGFKWAPSSDAQCDCKQEKDKNK